MFEMKNIQGEEKDMTLLAYQVFLAVVEQESFQKAAQVLNLTPSAISHAGGFHGDGIGISAVYPK